MSFAFPIDPGAEFSWANTKTLLALVGSRFTNIEKEQRG
jgi:hypothetical protein